jgi:hypothetical protein
VGTALQLIVAIVMPTALAGAAIGSIRAYRWCAERRRRVATLAEPIEQLCADVRRLHAQLDAVENQPGMRGKSSRVRAARAAYVDALCTACQELEVPAPAAAGGGHVPLAEIYRVEAALRRRGLDVRRTVTS